MEMQTDFSPSSDDVSLFEDVSESDVVEMTTSEDVQEQVAQEETTTDVKPEEVNVDAQAKPSDEMFILKHLGKEVSLGRDEVIMNAQKGLDYDRIRTKYDGLSAKISDLAKASNQSVDEFLNSLAKKADDIQISQRADELVNSGEYSLDAARKMAELEFKFNNQQRLKEEEDNQARMRAAQRDKLGQFVLNNPEFRNEFPDAKLPDEMVDALNDGVSIGEAWSNYQLAKERKALEELKGELEAYKQKELNKKSAAPKIRGDAENVLKDAFLEGLLGE